MPNNVSTIKLVDELLCHLLVHIHTYIRTYHINVCKEKVPNLIPTRYLHKQLHFYKHLNSVHCITFVSTVLAVHMVQSMLQ